MNRRRLNRLGALTEGAALIGLGVLAASGAACNKEPVGTNKEPLHINGPPIEPPLNGPSIQTPPTPSTSATPSAVPSVTSVPKAR